MRLDNFMFKRVIAEAPANMDWPWDQLTYWDYLSLILWLSYKHCYKLQEERKNMLDVAKQQQFQPFWDKKCFARSSLLLMGRIEILCFLNIPRNLVMNQEMKQVVCILFHIWGEWRRNSN